MSFRRRRLAGTTVTVAYDESEIAPPLQQERLERAIGRVFPEDCGILVLVEAAWSGEQAAWCLQKARAVMLNVEIDEPVDITVSLRQSCRAAGVPLVEAWGNPRGRAGEAPEGVHHHPRSPA